jgi:Conserved secreted protein
LKALPVLLIALLLAGCASLVPQLETPRLSIVNVEVLKSDLWEQRLRVRMRVQNPNDRALPIRGLTYRMEVAGEELAHGVSSASFTVPALGEAEFDMMVTANMASTLFRLLGRGDDSLKEQIDYRIVGKVSLSEGFLRSIPFEERGTFRLK